MRRVLWDRHSCKALRKSIWLLGGPSMQILISWSRVPSKSRFCSFVKILFWVENPLLWRSNRDGQNSCCTCHNTKGWKHICVLRKQAGNKLFTVHSSVLTLYFDFDFGGSDNGEDALKIALGKNVRSAQLASKSTNLRPGTQKTFGRKNTELAVSKSSISLGRLNLIFLAFGLWSMTKDD